MERASYKPNAPSDLTYPIRKAIWRSWIRALSWLRRHHVSPT